MSSGRKGAKSPRSAMSMILSSGLLNGLSSSVSSNEKATSVGGKDKEKKSKTLHSGYLLKLGGKTLISGGNWKRRFFVLEKKRLAYYETEEVWQAGARASGFVSLEFYDVCEEKETRKATNVFFIGSSDKNLFETTRHYFSAETLPEMTAWMSHVRSALKEARKSQRSAAARSLTEAETSQKKNEEKRREIEKEGHAHKKSFEQKHQMEAVAEPSLEPLTKARPRGPSGRKPPTDHRVTILRDDLRSKSNSLTTLEVNPKAESRLGTFLEEAEEFDQALFVNYDGMKQACSRKDSVYHSIISAGERNSVAAADGVTVVTEGAKPPVHVTPFRKLFGWLQSVFQSVKPLSRPQSKTS